MQFVLVMLVHWTRQVEEELGWTNCIVTLQAYNLSMLHSEFETTSPDIKQFRCSKSVELYFT